jgi:hypothetical protein
MRLKSFNLLNALSMVKGPGFAPAGKGRIAKKSRNLLH